MSIMKKLVVPVLAASVVAAPMSAAVAAPAPYKGASVVQTVSGEKNSAVGKAGLGAYVIGFLALAVVVGGIIIISDEDGRSSR